MQCDLYCPGETFALLRVYPRGALPPIPYVYVASVLDPSPSTYDTISKMMRSFVNTGSALPLGKGNWINQDILYASKLEGGFNIIYARSFFISLKIS